MEQPTIYDANCSMTILKSQEEITESDELERYKKQDDCSCLAQVV